MKATLTPNQIDERLDPSYIQWTNEFFLLENLTSRLVRYNEHGNYELDLASNIEKVTPTKFKIKIRENFFSNGERITIHDVKNTLSRVWEKGSSHVVLKDFVSALTLDDDSLIIELKAESNSFFYYLSLPDLGILHSSQLKDTILAKDFTSVSSGPFSYKKADDDTYYLVKNSYYKLSDMKYPDEVQLIPKFRKENMEECYENKIAIAVVTGSRMEEAEKILKEQSHLKLMGHPSDSTTYLRISKDSPLFKKKEHRQWIRYVINKNFRIKDGYLKGMVSPTNQFFHELSSAFLNKDEVNQIVNRPVKKPSDFPGKIVIKTNQSFLDVTNESLIRKLETIAELKIEIQADIKSEDILNTKEDLVLGVTSTDYRVPAEAINYLYFSNVHQLVDISKNIKKHFLSYQSEVNKTVATDHLRAISRQMLEDVQIIPLFHSGEPFIINTNLVDIGDTNHLFIYNFWKFKAL